MTDPEHDDVFEAYLKRRPVLPALDDDVEPPAALDQMVSAKAREAIGPRRVARVASAPAAAIGARTGGGGTDSAPADGAKPTMNRAPRWAVPIALAATVLLCLSVVMNISLNTNRPSPNLERMAAARADLKASAKANAIAESDAAAGAGARGNAQAANDGLTAGDDERRESLPGGVPSNEVILPGAKVAGVAGPRAPVVAESAAAPESAAPPGRAPAAPAAPAHPTNPKVWLQQIDALRSAGKAEQAEAEMRRFQAAFPGYAVTPASGPTVAPAPAAAPGDLPK